MFKLTKGEIKKKNQKKTTHYNGMIDINLEVLKKHVKL